MSEMPEAERVIRSILDPATGRITIQWTVSREHHPTALDKVTDAVYETAEQLGLAMPTPGVHLFRGTVGTSPGDADVVPLPMNRAARRRAARNF